MSNATLLEIKQGEDITIPVVLKKSDGTCYDLTGATEITATFNDGSTGFDLTLTAVEIVIGVNPTQGEISIKMSDTNSALLALGTQSFEVLVDEASGDKRIIQFIKCLDIVKRLL